MDNFKTDNQDKDNLVGKVMSDAVDVEQERLALIDEVRELKDILDQCKLGFEAILEEGYTDQTFIAIAFTLDRINSLESIRGES